MCGRAQKPFRQWLSLQAPGGAQLGPATHASSGASQGRPGTPAMSLSAAKCGAMEKLKEPDGATSAKHEQREGRHQGCWSRLRPASSCSVSGVECCARFTWLKGGDSALSSNFLCEVSHIEVSVSHIRHLPHVCKAFCASERAVRRKLPASLPVISRTRARDIRAL